MLQRYSKILPDSSEEVSEIVPSDAVELHRGDLSRRSYSDGGRSDPRPFAAPTGRLGVIIVGIYFLT